MSSFGYAAVLLLMIAESACIPVPSEVVMLFGGALAATGRLQIVAVIALGWAGNVIGSYIAWGVGRTGGRAAVSRWGRYVWLKEHDLDAAERWFARHGQAAVFLGRLLPVARTFISLPAGMADMPPLRFGLYTLAGCLPWTAALAAAGYALGSSWSKLLRWFSGATDVLAVLAGLLVLAGVLAVVRRRRREARVVEGGPPPGQAPSPAAPTSRSGR